jgi:hypothetical protein
MTNEQVIAAHDALGGRDVSSSFYLDELRRRDAERAETASYTLSRRVYVLTWVNGVFAAVAAGAAVLALFLRCG